MRVDIVDTVVKFKWVVLGTIVLILIGAGILSWWNDMQDKKSIEAGNIMYKTLMSNVDQDKMVNMLQSIIDGDYGNYEYLAKLKLASIYSKQDVNKAQEIYKDLANNKKLVPEFRELVKYLEVVLLLKSGNSHLLREKIAQLITQDHKIYQSSVKEIAAIEKINSGDVNGAMEIMQEIISDVNSDSIISKNIKDLMRIYSKK
ncbi:hypothetical protein LUA82_03375 [Neoehrlichia mikurensis]|uniref:Ancillary SecYEG translocon subunit/Cell division coordinator CpoB TPR domain-containing protein n=1 Tax=Neoehrlichia mikurensis TaxID=89586 RepID=A0A9Q9BYK1_9RICK|nr:tetratricopeptide repeat protein [Neoehrlichia mikurensis]UTO55209.1 hypothetical protein LUA82_03375 [Neoehrlichia mikurensis]UTO56129.1 hypothetical protein LUA81_03340 [Neoehrlichia mikurensis]